MHRAPRFLPLFAVLLVLVLASVTGYAQSGTTSAIGSVVDKTGASIAGAKVVITDSTRGLMRETRSDSTGEFSFLQLDPGTYSLTAEMTGFRTYKQDNLQLLVNQPTSVKVVLTVGSITERVDVSAEAPTLNTTDASLGNAFDQNQVRQLPLEGRNVPDLLTLQAGVAYTGNRQDVDRETIDTRSGAVNGARSDQSNITVDGVSANDEGGHAFTSVLPVTLDSVREFRVTTSNQNADQGGSSGAQVALVTKSGTNDFHGSLYEYTRNTFTSANDFFVKKAELESNRANAPPKLIRNIFGASLGGPLRKNRVFLFLNYEGTRRTEEQSKTVQVPTASLRDGAIIYQCVLDDPNCPASSVNGATPGSSYSVPQGYFGISPTQITAMDPLNLGPSNISLGYLKTAWPAPNSTAVGDGFNYSGFNFRAPISNTKNWYIAKFDYNITTDARHHVSLTSALANENLAGAPFLPGQVPSQAVVNFNKGLIANYTGVISSRLVNSLRYGFLRESQGVVGNSNQQVIYFEGLNNPRGAVTRTHAFQRPIHELTDDLSWIRGQHTIQFGTSLSFTRNPRTSFLQSYSAGFTNPTWLNFSGFAGKAGSSFNPPNHSFPAVNAVFFSSYDFPLAAILGMVPQVEAVYNFQRDGSALPQGEPATRRFALDGYEFYAQDSWRFRPNLTITYGLRYSLFSPPWETKGLQVSPTPNLTPWLEQRGMNMQNGIPSSVDPPIAFDLSGPANHKPGYWAWDYKDLGPHMAVAWSPHAQGGLPEKLLGGSDTTSIRAGFGMVYDRYGQGIVDAFDEAGSFGLSSTLFNSGGVETEASAPRLTGLTTIPIKDNNGNAVFLPAPPAKFPQVFPAGTFAIQWALDNAVKTPYSYTIDFSVGRTLPGGFSLDLSYVGRLSHRLLRQEDMAMPLDYRDKKSGVDYFTAVTELAKLYRGGVTSSNFNSSIVSSPVAAFWRNIVQPVSPGGAYKLGTTGGCGSGAPASTTDPLLMAFDLFCGGQLNETTPLLALDVVGVPDASLPLTYFTFTGQPYTFWNPQFASLPAWRTTGSANYHAFQLNLRHKMSSGLQFDLAYTFSRSIDTASDAERVGQTVFGGGGLGDSVINTWQPNALRAVSDFDATHQLNSNWLWELPMGRGQAFARNAKPWLEALAGGWQLSGLFRITSGFPVSIQNGFNFATNWSFQGNAIPIGPLKTGAFRVQTGPNAGNINLFPGNSAEASFRAPFPGESGTRNEIRGDGYFGLDAGLAKRWVMPWSESQRVQFRWEVFNVTNSVRFDVQSVNRAIGTFGSAFGNYTRLLTNPRVMQFALRYEF